MGDAFGFDVHDLTADHAGRELGFEVSDAPTEEHPNHNPSPRAM
jgi:hypothetical protein